MNSEKDASYDTITISRKIYEDLIDDQRLLNALRANGVDNWSGYDLSVDLAFEWKTAEMAEENTQ